MPVRDRQAGGHQRIADLEVAGQRQLDLVDVIAERATSSALAEALVLDPLELEAAAVPADASAPSARACAAARTVAADQASSAKITAGAPSGSSSVKSLSLAAR